MMVIVDGLVALLLFKLFGMNVLYILGLICAVSFIRMSLKASYIISVIEYIIDQVVEIQTVEEDENENL